VIVKGDVKEKMKKVQRFKGSRFIGSRFSAAAD
jgi:hypothetical protein